MLDWNNLVWPAVAAAVLSGMAVAIAFLRPERGSVILSLGLAGVSMALLAQRQ